MTFSIFLKGLQESSVQETWKAKAGRMLYGDLPASRAGQWTPSPDGSPFVTIFRSLTAEFGKLAL